MKRIGSVTWLSLAFFAFVAGSVYLVWLPMRGGELHEKGRYAYLQRVEFDYRDKAAQFAGNPVLLPRSGDRPYTVLGPPSNRDKTKYVWITLNEADDAIQRLTTVPSGEDFVLSCRSGESATGLIHDLQRLGKRRTRTDPGRCLDVRFRLAASGRQSPYTEQPRSARNGPMLFQQT